MSELRERVARVLAEEVGPALAMDGTAIERHGEELYRALRERFTVPPLTDREPSITIDDAYRIQLAIVARKLEREGVRHVGKKIGPNRIDTLPNERTTHGATCSYPTLGRRLYARP